MRKAVIFDERRRLGLEVERGRASTGAQSRYPTEMAYAARPALAGDGWGIGSVAFATLSRQSTPPTVSMTARPFPTRPDSCQPAPFPTSPPTFAPFQTCPTCHPIPDPTRHVALPTTRFDEPDQPVPGFSPFLFRQTRPASVQTSPTCRGKPRRTLRPDPFRRANPAQPSPALGSPPQTFPTSRPVPCLALPRHLSPVRLSEGTSK